MCAACLSSRASERPRANLRYGSSSYLQTDERPELQRKTETGKRLEKKKKVNIQCSVPTEGKKKKSKSVGGKTKTRSFAREKSTDSRRLSGSSLLSLLSDELSLRAFERESKKNPRGKRKGGEEEEEKKKKEKAAWKRGLCFFICFPAPLLEKILTYLCPS